MKKKYEALTFKSGEGFQSVRLFKIESDAIRFAEDHPTVTLLRHDSDGDYQYDEQHGRWEKVIPSEPAQEEE